MGLAPGSRIAATLGFGIDVTLLRAWYDRELTAGEKWEPRIRQELNEADVIVCQLSRDFLASDFCVLTEFETALQRNASGEAELIAYVLTACLWKETKLKEFQILPKDAKPLGSNKDKFWLEVYEGIQKALEKLRQQRASRPGRKALRSGSSNSGLPRARRRIHHVCQAAEPPRGDHARRTQENFGNASKRIKKSPGWDMHVPPLHSLKENKAVNSEPGRFRDMPCPALFQHARRPLSRRRSSHLAKPLPTGCHRGAAGLPRRLLPYPV